MTPVTRKAEQIWICFATIQRTSDRTVLMQTYQVKRTIFVTLSISSIIINFLFYSSSLLFNENIASINENFNESFKYMSYFWTRIILKTKLYFRSKNVLYIIVIASSFQQIRLNLQIFLQLHVYVEKFDSIKTHYIMNKNIGLNKC